MCEGIKYFNMCQIGHFPSEPNQEVAVSLLEWFMASETKTDSDSKKNEAKKI